MSEGRPQQGGDENIHDALRRGYEAMPVNDAQSIQEEIEAAAAIIRSAAEDTGSPLLEGVIEAVDNAERHGKAAVEKLQTGKANIAEYLASVAGIDVAAVASAGAAGSEVAPKKLSVAEEYEQKIEQELDERIEEYLRKIRSGKLESLPGYIPGLNERIQRAIEAGDMQKAESYLLLHRHSMTPVDMIIPAFAIGTEKAFAMLKELLDSDKEERLRKYLNIASDAPEDEKMAWAKRLLEGAVADPLHMVIAECFKRDLPPDKWIDDYSINEDEKKVRRWQSFIPPLPPSMMAPLDRPQTGIYELADEFLGDRDINPLFMYKTLTNVIRHVRDANLQRRLVEHYLQLTPGIIFDKDELYKFKRVGEAVLESPACTPGMADEFTKMIKEKLADILPGNEFGQQKYLGEWQALVMRKFQKLPPAEVIAYMNQLEDRLLTIPELPERTDYSVSDPMYSPSVSNAKLATFLIEEAARDCAKRGNFVDAGQYIRGIASSFGQETMFDHCLQYALSGDDIQCMKPDELEGMFDPRVQAKIDLLETMGNGDPEAITNKTMETLTKKFTNFGNDNAYDALAVKAVEQVMNTDKARGKALARDILDMFASKRLVSRDSYRQLMAILIREGDTDRIAEAYNTIYRHRNGETLEKRENRIALAYNWLIPMIQGVKRTQK